MYGCQVYYVMLKKCKYFYLGQVLLGYVEIWCVNSKDVNIVL